MDDEQANNLLKRLQQARLNGSIRQAPLWKDKDDSEEEDEAEEDNDLGEIARGLEDEGQVNVSNDVMSLVDDDTDPDFGRSSSSFKDLDENENQFSDSDEVVSTREGG